GMLSRRLRSGGFATPKKSGAGIGAQNGRASTHSRKVSTGAVGGGPLSCVSMKSNRRILDAWQAAEVTTTKKTASQRCRGNMIMGGVPNIMFRRIQIILRILNSSIHNIQ